MVLNGYKVQLRGNVTLLARHMRVLGTIFRYRRQGRIKGESMQPIQMAKCKLPKYRI